MLFESYSLFFEIIMFVIVFVTCRFVFQKGWLNNLLILCGNLLILTNIVTPRSIFWLSVLALLAFGAGWALQRKPKVWPLALSLVLLVVAFCCRNYPLVQSFFSESFAKNVNVIEKIGLSYILFRIIHWLVESYRGSLRSCNLLSYFNYLFFFPTFMAGPIDTYNNFDYYVHTTRVKFHGRMALAGVGRVFWGAVKTLLVVPLILPYAVDYHLFYDMMGAWGGFIAAALLYSAYIYIDFSGYCDIAIGMAYLMGIRTPENFARPYLASNISEFWKRWHITFSTFLRIYVFKPLIAFFNRFSIRRYRMVVSVCAYLLTFLVCGLWHGSTFNFVLWGLWHGIGLSCYKVLRPRFLPRISSWSPKTVRSVGIIATFLFVTIGWVFFNYSGDELLIIVKMLFS